MSHFFLADCNNFFVSCERLFNPKLERKPVLVLSSNDGCVIARSQESKLLGFKMGDPHFKIKKECERVGIQVLSSNYQLYTDISKRVMSVLSECAPDIEVYSIDEAFFKLPDVFKEQDLLQEAIRIKKLVKKWVGIPISIGIAPTKTLAKAANHIAKQKHQKTGIFSLMKPLLQQKALSEFPLDEVWGIGPGLSQKLKNLRVYSVEDFLKIEPHVLKQKLGVLGERIYWELKGVSTSNLQKPEPKKSITVSRSFGETSSCILEMQEAISTFASTACSKLRNQKSLTSAIHVYVEIASLEKGQYIKKQYGINTIFQVPTNDTSQVITSAKKCLNKLYVEGEEYKKCGIVLLDLISEKDFIPDFFLGKVSEKRSAVMCSIDNINKRFGKNTIFLAAVVTKGNWRNRAEYLSPYSTTDLDQLPVASARGSKT
jgi:DNA polymerase V